LLTQSIAAFADETAVSALIEALEKECSSYCLLAGYEDLPATVHSDIDFMVSRQDFERLPRIFASLACKINFRLVQSLQHQTTACCYYLAQSQPGQVLYLYPDACSDYRRSGRTWLQSETVLAGRRKDSNGSWIPAPANDFLYHLIKCIDKLSFAERHTQKLSRVFSEDRQGCTDALTRRLTAVSAQLVVEAAASGNWKPVIEVIHELDKELLASTPADSLRMKLEELRRRILRWFQPTGLCVVVLGPDEKYRSRVTESYISALTMAFRKAAEFHLGPYLLRGSETSKAHTHSKQSQVGLASMTKMLYLWADYVLGYYLRIRPRMVRSTLVVLDCCDSSLLSYVYRRSGYKPRWLTRQIGRFIPKPDLILVLDASADLLQAHKQEAAAAVRGRAILLDGTRTLEQVIHECADQTMILLESRTAMRLHLD